MKIRLCVIGGGSVNWMRGLMKDVYTLNGVEGGEIRLVDPNTEHVTSVKNMLLKFNELTDKNFEVSVVEDRKAALAGCDFVLTTFSPGAMDAFFNDLEIPVKYGVRLPVSMTCGVSGISAADSTEIVEDMTLKPNECFIETGGGIFDCSLETQLSGLKRERTRDPRRLKNNASMSRENTRPTCHNCCSGIPSPWWYQLFCQTYMKRTCYPEGRAYHSDRCGDISQRPLSLRRGPLRLTMKPLPPEKVRLLPYSRCRPETAARRKRPVLRNRTLREPAPPQTEG